MTTRRPSSRSSSSVPDGHLLVGRFGRAVGLKGEVELTVLSDDPTRFSPGRTVFLADDLRPLTVSSARTHGDRTIVAFDQVADRDTAEALRGSLAVIPADQARALAPDEHWDHDLIGTPVRTVGGDELGEVTDVLHGPANDVLVVGPSGRLIPLARAMVTSIGRDAIVIDPIPGLLDEPDGLGG